MKLRTKAVKAVKTISSPLGDSMPTFEDVTIPPHTGGRCDHERSVVRYVVMLHEPTFDKHPKTGKRLYYEWYMVRLHRRYLSWYNKKSIDRRIRDRVNFTHDEVDVKIRAGEFTFDRAYQPTRLSDGPIAYETREAAEKFVRGQLRKKTALSVAVKNGYQVKIVQIDLWYQLNRQFHITNEFDPRPWAFRIKMVNE